LMGRLIMEWERGLGVCSGGHPTRGSCHDAPSPLYQQAGVSLEAVL
jgi:hypothetical protein